MCLRVCSNICMARVGYLSVFPGMATSKEISYICCQYVVIAWQRQRRRRQRQHGVDDSIRFDSIRYDTIPYDTIKDVHYINMFFFSYTINNNNIPYYCFNYVVVLIVVVIVVVSVAISI